VPGDLHGKLGARRVGAAYVRCPGRGACETDEMLRVSLAKESDGEGQLPSP
jgi:hypothetical protein